jgi:hypothetical protein
MASFQAVAGATFLRVYSPAVAAPQLVHGALHVNVVG